MCLDTNTPLLFIAPQIVIWKSSSEMHTKIYESLPITSASRYEEEICLEFHEKIPVSGDTLITVFNKPLIKLKKVINPPCSLPINVNNFSSHPWYGYTD